jgi:hypothetical protein
LLVKMVYRNHGQLLRFIQTNYRKLHNLAKIFCLVFGQSRWQRSATWIDLKCQHKPEPPNCSTEGC